MQPSLAINQPKPDTRPWFDRWLQIDEQQGRMIRVGDHWLADFASCSYLGFDLDREIIAAVSAAAGEGPCSTRRSRRA